LVLLTGGCDPITQCSYTEHRRLTSPTGAIDALIVEGGCGATTSGSTMVYIVAAHQSFDGNASFDPSLAMFRATADTLNDFRFAWVGNEVFEIRYEKVRIFSFTNFGEIREPDGSKKEYEIKLVQTKL